LRLKQARASNPPAPERIIPNPEAFLLSPVAACPFAASLPTTSAEFPAFCSEDVIIT